MGRKFEDKEFIQYILIERAKATPLYLAKLEGYFGVSGISKVIDKINETNNSALMKLIETIGER